MPSNRIGVRPKAATVAEHAMIECLRMKKPSHRWQTPSHTASLDPSHVRPHALDERFILRFASGFEGWAHLRQERQDVDPRALDDPELIVAIQCWLAARGTFQLNLFANDEPILSRSFVEDELDSPYPPNQRPIRLASLAPSNADIIDALGLQSTLIACEDSTERPPGTDLPRLGPDLNPDLDRLAALQPDLVLSSLSVPGMERVVMGLRTRHIPQAVLAPRSIADVQRGLLRVGTRCQVPSIARTVVEAMDDERQRLTATSMRASTGVYVEWWPRPMFSPGRDTYLNELITLAGGHNVFAHRAGASVEIQPDELVKADPAICFLSWCGVDVSRLDPHRLIHRPGLESLRAAHHGHVYPLDERFSGRPGPKMLEAARQMAERIHELSSKPMRRALR